MALVLALPGYGAVLMVPAAASSSADSGISGGSIGIGGGAQGQDCQPNVAPTVGVNSFFDTAISQQLGPGWIAGDGTYSAQLPGGGESFVFADTLIGAAQSNGTASVTGVIANSELVGSTAALQSDYGGSYNAPAPLILDAQGGGAHWQPSATYVENGQQLVFVNEFTPVSGSFYDKFVGRSGIAVMSISASGTPTYSSLGLLPTDANTQWGIAVTMDAAYIYVYGINSPAGAFQGMEVARVPQGQSLNAAAWQYWNGAQWVTGQSNAIVIGTGNRLTGVMPQAGDNGYVAVSIPNGILVDTTVDLSYACTPQGPWSTPQPMYTIPQVGAGHNGEIAYTPTFHPEISGQGGVVVSYNINYTGSLATLEQNVHAYQPQFLTFSGGNATDTITFNTQGGSAVAPVNGLDGTSVTLPGAPIYPGYTFAGWNSATDGSGTTYGGGAAYTLAGSATLYAQWTPTIDTVSFNTQGGSAVAPVSGLDGTTVTLPAAPTRAGYTFAGWFAAASGGSALTSPYTLAGSTTLYAQWTPNPTDTLTFNTQGGSAVAPVSGLDGTSVTLPGAPIHPGYTFAGWNSAADGSGTTYGGGAAYTLAGSTTLYAQWTPNPTDTLTFNTQGGSAVAPVSGLDGTSVLLPGAPIHPGYTFAGWNSAADGSGTTYGGGAAYTLAGSTTLYAQWTPNPTDTLTFNTQGGSAVAPVSGLDGTTVTLPAAPTRAGYTFAGWFAAASGGSALTSPYTLAGSTTLYAQWTPNPTDTLTFNTQGGSAVAPVSGLDGTSVLLPGAPIHPGYTFAGWNSAADGSGTTYGGGAAYTLAGSTTLYAQWTPNPTDTLTFNTQGGSAVAPVSGLDGTTVTLPAAPTRAGYTFAGWNAAA